MSKWILIKGNCINLNNIVAVHAPYKIEEHWKLSLETTAGEIFSITFDKEEEVKAEWKRIVKYLFD